MICGLEFGPDAGSVTREGTVARDVPSVGDGDRRVIALHLEDVPAREERGASIRVVISPRTTGRSNYILGHAELPPGGVDEAHAHDYGEETIFVLEGEGVLQAHGEMFELRPGSCVFIPRGVVHSFRNTGSAPLL